MSLHRILGSGLIVPGAGNPWWDPLNEGLAVVAAYQPLGAASYAASKVNLVNPGVFDLGDGVSFPAWTEVTGWTFNRLNPDYLTTGITPANGWSAICFFNSIDDLIAAGQTLFAESGTVGRSFGIEIYTAAANAVYYKNGNFVVQAPDHLAGSLATCPGQGYRDGVANGGPIGPWTGPATHTIWIGQRNPANLPMGGVITGIAFYSADVGFRIAQIHAAGVAAGL